MFLLVCVLADLCEDLNLYYYVFFRWLYLTCLILKKMKQYNAVIAEAQIAK